MVYFLFITAEIIRIIIILDAHGYFHCFMFPPHNYETKTEGGVI